MERRRVEIQIRTSLQHLWAEISEKLSDIADPNIKYGGGPVALRAALTNASEGIAALELLEATIASGDTLAVEASNRPDADRFGRELSDLQDKLTRSKAEFHERRQSVDVKLKKVIGLLDQFKEGLRQ